VSDHNENHVTRDELRAELKAMSNRHLLYLGMAVGLIRLDLPTPVTVGAILAMMAKGAAVLVFGWK
jgi:hypothetical protein